MADVYYYLKKENFENTLRFGIKLSDAYFSEININGTNKKYLLALLNPKDNLDKFNSNEYACIRANLNNDYLFVSDKNLLDTPYFEEFLTPICDYKYGDFKNPVVVVTCSFLPDQIFKINKYIDVPVLYNSSEELYYECASQKLKDLLPNSNEIILKALLEEANKKKLINTINLSSNTIYKQGSSCFFS